MTSQILSLDEIFGDDVKQPAEQITDLDALYTGRAEKGTDEALAEFVGQETLGQAGLPDVKLRGQISSADTYQEKLNQFRAIFPDGDLVLVPGGEGNPSNKRHGEILFRPDMSTPYSKLDGKFFEGQQGKGIEFLSDLSEFLYDDLGVIMGEIAAGSKKVAKVVAPFTKPVPYLGTLTTGFELFPLAFRMGTYAFVGEVAQEGVQELKGINEQSFAEISETAGYKGLLSTVGTTILTPVINKLGNIFGGRGILARSDEAGSANAAVEEINSILADLKIIDAKGNLVQIPPLPANLLVDNPIAQRIGKQTAATGGKLSGQYVRINEALSLALQNVGDAESAMKLIDLLNIATNFEKNRLFDLVNYARLGSLQFDQINKAEQKRILNVFGIKNIDELKDLPQSEIDKVIEESMEAFAGPGGVLDKTYQEAVKTLRKFKPDGIKFDLTDIKAIATKGSFGITQKKKKLNLSADDLEEYILATFGKDRLINVQNQANKLIPEDATEDAIEEIYKTTYRQYIISQQGADPLIKINQTDKKLENILNGFRDIESDPLFRVSDTVVTSPPSGGTTSVFTPTGASGPRKITTFDFLFDARKQLQEILSQPIGSISQDQKRLALELMTELDNVIKTGPANSNEAWSKAYQSLVNITNEQNKLLNLPIILSLGRGNYTQLLKGYMNPSTSVRDLKLLFQTMDEKGSMAFKQGFLNQLIGNADNLKNLPKELNKYDRETLQFIFDKPTVTALENLSGFIKKLDDANFTKILETQDKFARSIDIFMSNKNTKSISDALKFIENLDGGFNNPVGKSFHDGIINRLFQKSTEKVKGKLTLNQSKYRKFIEELKLNGIYDTFDTKTQKLLEDIDLVKDFLVQGGDAGTSIEAATIADATKGILTGRTNIGPLLSTFVEIIGLGKLFTSTGGRAFLIGGDKGKPQFKPNSVQRTIGAVVTELVGSNITPKDDQNLDKLFEILEVVSPLSSDEAEAGTLQPDVKIGVDMPNANISTGDIEPLSFLNQTSINPASRLGQVNMTAPINLAAADPNTMERGRQLFSGPNEITFASKGGIMNARKVMQRVI